MLLIDTEAYKISRNVLGVVDVECMLLIGGVLDKILHFIREIPRALESASFN